MSVRICIPSKAIRPAASYARSRASAGVGPSAVTLSTRPPAVTISPVALGGAGVGDLGQLRGRLEAADHVALRGGLRVAGRGEDQGHRPVVGELGLGPASPPGSRAARQRSTQVGAQPRQHRLRLGVAEAGVELEHLRARRRRSSGRRRGRRGRAAARAPSRRRSAGARPRRSPRPRPAPKPGTGE